MLGLHLGDATVDLTVRLPRLPQPGEEVMMHGWRAEAGGSAANTAIVVARWGVQARLLARLGQDLWGRFWRQRLDAIPHLDLTFLQTDPERPTGLVLALVDASGERTFVTHRGANIALKPPDLNAFFQPRPAYLHLTGYSALEGPHQATAQRMLAEAQARGVPVVLDVPPLEDEGAARRLRAWLRQVHILSLGVEAARWLFGPSASEEALLARLQGQVPIVALRLGPRGAYVAWAGARLRLPGLPMDPVDTTGAGDAFTAGLILGWLWRWPPPRAAWFAHLLGAVATTREGAGPALPGPADLRPWLSRLSAYLPPDLPAALGGKG